MPAQRRKLMEVWNGDGWAPYPDVDTLLRHGHRLTDEQALILLNDTRDRNGALPGFSAEEAHLALSNRQRRAKVPEDDSR
jgi:hypothetical protein